MTSTASESLDSVFETNPYASVQNLSSQEAAVLWEYAKLARHLYLVRLFLHSSVLIWSVISAMFTGVDLPYVLGHPADERAERTAGPVPRCSVEDFGDEDGVGAYAGSYRYPFSMHAVD